MRPSLGTYRYGLTDQRCRTRWASRAQPGAARRDRHSTPVTRPPGSVTRWRAAVWGSTRTPAPRTAADRRADSSPPGVPRPRVRWPRGAGGGPVPAPGAAAGAGAAAAVAGGVAADGVAAGAAAG